MPQKVVAHFIDHTVVKGTSVDVDPGKPRCHIRTEDAVLEVDLSQLKALYFVKDLTGRPEYTESRATEQGDSRLRGSHAVKLTFMDGEAIHALMNRFPPNRPFYFVLPVDAASNNERILVNRDAVVSVEPLDLSTVQKPGPDEGGGKPTIGRTSWVFDGKGIREIDGQPPR